MNYQPKRRCLLQSIATIQPGYPFRGKLELNDNGDAFVVQYRHLVAGEPLDDTQGHTLDRVSLTGRKRPEYLCSGDILFMAKGTRNDAAVVRELPNNTVCTPNFYLIRLTPGACNLIPEFLAWQINHFDAQRYFAERSQGSAVPSITKSELENLPIVMPSLKQQKVMVELITAARREKQQLNQLIENRQRMIDAVGHQLLRPDTTIGN
tara:strand:+ start:411 stop:1034 length:624 start_codon:yes stop_codon:yes gene_type:complete